MTSITPLNDVADRGAPSRKLLRAASSFAVFTFAFGSIAAGQSGTGTGLKGEYFANTDLKAPVALTRTDPTVNFTWGTTAPVSSIVPDKFSARWSGKIEAPVTGAYTFVTRSDDGVRLWVNQKLLINHWDDHGADWDQSVPVNLTAGQRYDIQLEYYENKGNSLIQLYWSYPNQAEQVIPQTRLYPNGITLQPAPPVVSRHWVSDLNWISAMNGWGPVELDRSNGELAGKDGRTMSIGGRKYYSGLGVHARSEIRYPLFDRYDMFRAIVGVDDEVGDRGSVVFEVWLDGQKKFTSPVMKGNMPGLAIEVPVEGAREMRLVVLDGGDGIGYDHADWAEARLEGVESIKYLSSMNWMSATNGLGPVEKDRANGGVEAKDGEKIRLAGMTYNRGLGTYANAEIRYDLDQKYERFSAVIGIDDSVGNGGSAIFEVWADNARLYRSQTMRGNMRSEPISLIVTGRETLVLKVLDAGDGQARDAASWADAQLLPREVGGTLPAVPAELSAEAGNATVKLSWKASQGATSYQVFRGTTSTVENIPIATNITGTTYTNSGLTNGTKYYYRLKAVNNFGASEYSSMVSATPILVIPPPTAAPTNLTATPGDTTITLSWGAVQGATGYRIFRGTTSNGQSSTPLATVNGTTFTNTGLTNGTAYFYKVAAINAGGQGPMSAQATATPTTGLSAPTSLTATPGDRQITLTWNGVTGATGYRVFRGTTSNGQSTTAITTVNGTSFTNTGLTNGTAYFYKVAAISATGQGPLSNEATATPTTSLTAPTNLTAVPRSGSVVLNWGAVTGATSYRVFRGTTSNGQGATAIASPTGTTFTNTGLTNGTAYFYKVASVNAGGQSPMSAEASATPVAVPVAPTGLSVTSGDAVITVSWTAVTGADTYNVYRGTTPNGQAATAVATGLTSPTFQNTGLTNGTTYYYKVTAVNGSGESPRSAEIIGTPVSQPPTVDEPTRAAYRLLRQATWGPRPGDLDRVKQIGAAAFLTEQFAAPASTFPDTLFDQSLEWTQERFMQNAVTGQDQLRQRVAFALHKIWVVSGVEVDCPDSFITYYRILMNNAFGNYRNLMREITTNPAMGRYLNMLNNKSQASSGVEPNENYARELAQLFTVGLTRLNPDGSAQLDGQGRPVPTYTEEDVKELSRMLTGWTFGDGNPATVPTNLAPENDRVPMEPVQRFHDVGTKVFLGNNIAGAQQARPEMEQALDILFNHPNLPVFVSKQLIQMLVKSNPSPAYVQAISAVFVNNGSNVRGDLQAVVRAILTHPEATGPSTTGNKMMEPVLFVVSQLRSLGATVADFPFMTDKAEEMGQKVLYPPSVFSYFSPGFRIRGTSLGGPEFQIYTSVTSLVRVNFIGQLISNSFGADVTINYQPFTSRAADAGALVDYCNLLFMGGNMSTQMRSDIINAIQATPATNTTERVRTALYLTMAGAQYQVDR